MKISEVIVRPILTEKSTLLREKENKYSFRVHKKANKLMVKKAIIEAFNVHPEEVNMLNMKGKKKRVRYKQGFTSSFKKAIVTLRKGEKISIFEGV